MNVGKENVVNSTVVANKFLELAQNNDDIIQQMKLQKLVYYAYGWNLAINNYGLTEDKPAAWEYGPLFHDLWLKTNKYGSNPISEIIETTGEISLNEDQNRLIEKVYNVYKDFTGIELSFKTHEVGGPWHQVYTKEKRGEISDESIQTYFTKLADK